MNTVDGLDGDSDVHPLTRSEAVERLELEITELRDKRMPFVDARYDLQAKLDVASQDERLEIESRIEELTGQIKPLIEAVNDRNDQIDKIGEEADNNLWKQDVVQRAKPMLDFLGSCEGVNEPRLESRARNEFINNRHVEIEFDFEDRGKTNHGRLTILANGAVRLYAIEHGAVFRKICAELEQHLNSTGSRNGREINFGQVEAYRYKTDSD